MTQPLDLTTLSEAEKDALIGALLARIDALTARVAALEGENKGLRERLDQPPKTPDNSSLPPSRGHKANGAGTTRPKAKPHAGSHRALHPEPTRRAG
jgi:transposase